MNAAANSIVAVLLSTPHPALRATFPDFAGKGKPIGICLRKPCPSVR